MTHIAVLKRNFAQYSRGKDMKEVLQGSTMKLHNFYNQGGGLETGLTVQEQKHLLPSIIKCDPTDKAFRDTVEKYYENFKVILADGEDLALEIGLTNPDKPLVYEDKGKEVYNPPLNESDYLKYRFAKVHPKVAASADEGEQDGTKMFVMVDLNQEENKTQLRAAQKKQANLHYYENVSNSPDLLEQYHFLLTNNNSGTYAEKQTVITNVIERDPAKYIALVEDKLALMKYLLMRAQVLKIVELINGDWVYKADMKTLGKNLTEAAKFLAKDNEPYLTKIQNQMK